MCKDTGEAANMIIYDQTLFDNKHFESRRKLILKSKNFMRANNPDKKDTLLQPDDAIKDSCC